MAKLDLNGKGVQELNELLEETQKNLYSLKFNNAVSSVENTAGIKLTRRNIARIKTALGAKDLEGSEVKRDKIQTRRRLAKKIKK